MMTQFVDERTTKWRRLLVRVLLRLCILSAALGYAPKHAHAGLIHASTGDAAYVAYGDTMNYAAALAIATGSGDTFRGSAGYLGGGWFITAVHNLIATPSDQSTIFDNFAVSMGSNFLTERGDTFYISKDDWYMNPGYLGTGTGPDIALGFSQEAKDTLTYVDPIVLYEGPDVFGSELAFVGYGATGTGTTGATTFDGQKRAGRNTVDGTGTLLDSTNYRSATFFPANNPFGNNMGILDVNGDSGGLVLDDLSLIPQLVGIVSYRGGGDKYFATTAFTRIAPHVQWIRDVQASRTEVPEPSSMLLFGVGALGMSLRRRRQAKNALLPLRICILSAVLLGYAPKHAHAIGMHNSNITPQSAYLEYAQLFPSVGGLFAYNGATPSSFGSGVLIHPNFVLTAGHVVLSNDSNPTSFYNDFQFVLGPNTSTGAQEYQFADEVFLAPGYSGVEQGVDLALLYFETPFVTAAPAEIYQGQVQVGDVASIVGYGDYGSPATGSINTDGKRRAGENIVESVTVSDDYLFYRFRGPSETNFLPLGSLGLPGDSGGGWFIETLNGFELAGITSGGSGSGALFYGLRTSAVQVGLNLDFIDSTIASKTAVPEPASGLLFAVGIPLMSRLRKRN